MTVLHDLIPARARKAVYNVLASVFGVELALDVVGWGLIPTDLQAKLVIVAGLLGFALAGANTAPKVD